MTHGRSEKKDIGIGATTKDLKQLLLTVEQYIKLTIFITKINIVKLVQ